VPPRLSHARKAGALHSRSTDARKPEETDMKRSRTRSLVDLGAASRRTLGAEGQFTDFVRMLDHWGIARD
jgi:hypothetical protein